MSAAEKPVRHDFNFSMGDDSKRRLDDLMARCGHNNLNLTVARSLALLEWVIDQVDNERVVGSIRYGDELDFKQLEERPELLRPRPRPQLVATPVPVVAAESITEAADEPEPAAEPVAEVAADPAPLNPKLQARERIDPEPAPEPRIRSRRVFQHKAYTPSDDGPVKTYEFLRANTVRRGQPAPVKYGNHSMPGNLYLDHMQQLIDAVTLNPTVTHFRIDPTDNFISFCGYLPKKGWCDINLVTGQWSPDPHLNGGVWWCYPVDQAIEYLRRHGVSAPPGPDLDETPPDF